MLTFSFQFIQDPGILKGALPHLKFFNGSFVNPTIFVDQMASDGGLAGVYMSNDQNVDESLLLSHLGSDLLGVFSTPVFWWHTHCKGQRQQIET